MEQNKIERVLAVLYLISAILSIMTLVCTVMPWVHWSEILDVCPNYRCGCILYGSNGFTAFQGGRIIFCHFAAFASSPIIIISLVLAGYQGYRVCILAKRRTQVKNTQYRRTRSQDAASSDQVETEAISGFTCWRILGGLSALVAALLFVHAVIATVGYHKSCYEYRKTLVKIMQATGNGAKVIYDRLTCGAIFDFMDYMEPTTRPFRVLDDAKHSPWHQVRDFYRGGLINTGVALQIGMACLWINFIMWISATIYNIKLARSNGHCCSRET